MRSLATENMLEPTTGCSQPGLFVLLLLLLLLQEGTIQLVDVGACTVIHTEQAHSGAVWSLALLPDKSGFVSGSADKTIKFWTWAVITVQQQQDAAVADDAAAAAGKKKKKGKKGQDDDEDAAAAAETVVVRQLGSVRHGF
jgi:hypothetical protein